MERSVINKILKTMMLGMFLWSCSENSKTISSSDTQIAQAWDNFENGDYGLAKQEFEAVVTSEPGNKVALSGLGWSKLRLGDISGAYSEFQLAKSNTVLDGYAGSALIALATDVYSDAISDALSLLLADNDYVFSHDPSIDHKDIKLVAAFGYFFEGNYSACKNMVLQLNPSYMSNPTPAQLLQELERLGGLIGG